MPMVKTHPSYFAVEQISTSHIVTVQGIPKLFEERESAQFFADGLNYGGDIEFRVVTVKVKQASTD